MKVKVQLRNEKAVVPFKAHEDDYCYDIVATSCEEIAPDTFKYGTGLSFEIVRPYPSNLTLSIDLRPRSSVWKTGMVLSNCTGTLDEGYRGEVCAVFYHVLKNRPRYQVGDRIGQIKIGCAVPMEFEITEELSTSERGEKGYGSSGK